MTPEMHWEAFEIRLAEDRLNGHEVRVWARIGKEDAILRCRFRRGDTLANLPSVLDEMQRAFLAAVESRTGAAPG